MCRLKQHNNKWRHGRYKLSRNHLDKKLIHKQLGLQLLLSIRILEGKQRT